MSKSLAIDEEFQAENYPKNIEPLNLLRPIYFGQFHFVDRFC